MNLDPITLQSNLSCESLVLVPNGSGEFRLTVNARHWESGHEQDVQLHVDSITLCHQKLAELASAIQAWLDSDLVGVSAFIGTFELTSHSESTLRFVFAARDDVISSGDKPVLTVEHRLSRNSAEFCFVTDQSCLAIFVSGVRSHLARFGVADGEAGDVS